MSTEDPRAALMAALAKWREEQARIDDPEARDKNLKVAIASVGLAAAYDVFVKAESDSDNAYQSPVLPGELRYRTLDGTTHHRLDTGWANGIRLSQMSGCPVQDLDLMNLRALMLRALTVVEDGLDERGLLTRATQATREVRD